MIALITARSGSKSIPDKNIKLLGGKPLLVWSIETALACGLSPIVSSDSEKYLDIAKWYGAETMLRPEGVSQDNTSHFETLVHEVPRIVPYPTEIVLFQPTSPFRKEADVRKAIDLFHGEQFDSVIAGVRIPDKWHPDEALQVVDGKVRMASGVPVRHRKVRRQDYSPSFVPAGSIYIFRTRNLSEGSLYGDRVGVLEVDASVNINDREDWEKAEQLATVWKQS